MASSWTGIVEAHSSTTFSLSGTGACGAQLSVPHGTYVLTSNVTTAGGAPCPGAGLVIAAVHVTLDLNGFKIAGDGNGDGTGRTTSLPDYQGFIGDAGVQVDPGVTGFRITGNAAVDCTDANRDSNVNAIVGFDAGIRVHGSPGTATERGLITKLHIRDNIGSLESDYGDGISIDNSSYITVGGSATTDGNCIRHNGFLSGVGVYEDPALDTTHHITISNNSIVDNDINNGPAGLTGFSSQDKGVRLEPGVRDNVVENNLITRSGLEGVAIFPGIYDANRTTGNVVRKNTITANGFHEYVGPTAAGCPEPGTTCATDPEPHTRNGEEVANGTEPGPRGYAQFAHRKGDGIRVLGAIESDGFRGVFGDVFGGNFTTGNTIGGPTSGTPGRGGTGNGNLVCGNAASGIRVDGGARPTGVAPDPLFPTAHKNIIQNNTSGGPAATPTCASNNVEVAPVPGAFDYYDGNTATNSTAGHPPCSSNTWSGNKDLDGVTPLPDSTRNHTCLS